MQPSERVLELIMTGALLIDLKSRVKGVVHRQEVLTLLSDSNQVHRHIDCADHVLQAYGYQTSRTVSERSAKTSFNSLPELFPPLFGTMFAPAQRAIYALADDSSKEAHIG
jgi:hypothetical protein